MEGKGCVLTNCRNSQNPLLALAKECEEEERGGALRRNQDSTEGDEKGDSPHVRNSDQRKRSNTLQKEKKTCCSSTSSLDSYCVTNARITSLVLIQAPRQNQRKSSFYDSKLPTGGKREVSLLKPENSTFSPCLG